MKLIIITIQFMELSKVVLENLQYLPLLQLHSPFQVVVLDERIINFHLHTKKIITNNSNSSVANKISDIAYSVM